MHVERIMVKTGPEKKMAVESPIGRRSTDSLISQRKRPPRIPWATSLHLVAMSDGPSGEELVNHMRGAMTAIWMRHRMKRRCQEEASVQYLGRWPGLPLAPNLPLIQTYLIPTLLAVKQNPATTAKVYPNHFSFPVLSSKSPPRRTSWRKDKT